MDAGFAAKKQTTTS